MSRVRLAPSCRADSRSRCRDGQMVSWKRTKGTKRSEVKTGFQRFVRSGRHRGSLLPRVRTKKPKQRQMTEECSGSAGCMQGDDRGAVVTKAACVRPRKGREQNAYRSTSLRTSAACVTIKAQQQHTALLWNPPAAIRARL
jgi:hypothetical protein